MKKMMFTLIALLTMSAAANAMSYEQARNEALFLTDKMAYELNLTDAQYEAAYEINLDYLMSVTSVNDVYSVYWERRNLDLSYILYQWQWDAYLAANYFYRPLYWSAGHWHFGVYARYTTRDFFYFGRPDFYVTYRGGHAWHMNGGRSYYHGRIDQIRPPLGNNRQHFGMRTRFDNGEFRHSGRSYGDNRGYRSGSSTRVTAGNGRMSNDRRFGNSQGDNSNRRFGNSDNSNRRFGNSEGDNSNRRFGNSQSEGNRRFGSSSSQPNNRPSASSFNNGSNRSSIESSGSNRSTIESSGSSNRRSFIGSSSSNSRPNIVGSFSSSNSSSSSNRSSNSIRPNIGSSSNSYSSGSSSRSNIGPSSSRSTIGSSSSSRPNFGTSSSGSSSSNRSSSNRSSSSSSSRSHFGGSRR